MLDDEGGVCSLPDRHLELVVLYVRWAAFQELAAQQSADPDVNYSGSITSSAMSALELNAQRAEGSYRFALARAVRAAAESGAVVWKMDKWS